MLIREYVNKLINNKRIVILSINEKSENYKYKDQFVKLLKSTDNKYKFYEKNDPENTDFDVMFNFYDKEIKPRYKNVKCGSLHEIAELDGSYKYYMSIKVSFPDRICNMKLQFKEFSVNIVSYKEKIVS